MTATPHPDGYVLSRNYEASSRLNYQFYLWKETLQFGLHPNVVVPMKKPCIADVATGTAIWLTNIARTLLQDAQLDGFDINLSQCPPVPWLPVNIRLRVMDMFEDVPADLVEKYDIVHVRLVLLVVPNNDPRSIIRNLFKMLKPNGFIQWEDLHTSNSYIVKVDPSIEAPAMQSMQQFLAAQDPWVANLATILNENGYVDAQTYHYRDSLSEAKAFFDMHLTKDEELAMTTFKGTAQGTSMLQRITSLYEESQMGIVLCTPKIVCVARKPGQVS